MSAARRNLKEAAGKTLARRTETAYEAGVPDKKANIFKVQYLHGRRARRCGGHKREGGCALPGEICPPATAERKVATGTERRRDGRAEVSRGHSRSADRTEGPNVLYGIGAQNLWSAQHRCRRPRVSSRRLSVW